MSASVLDFMGFAQKGGSVLSFVRLAEDQGGAEPGAHRRAAGRRGARLRRRRRRLGRRAADGAPRPHPRARQPARDPGRRIALEPGCRACRSSALLEKIEFAAGAERVETMDAQRLARRVPRRHDRLQHRRDGLRLAARPGAGRPGGDAARDRAERRRGREPTRRRSRSAGSPPPTRRRRASCCTSPTRRRARRRRSTS